MSQDPLPCVHLNQIILRGRSIRKHNRFKISSPIVHSKLIWITRFAVPHRKGDYLRLVKLYGVVLTVVIRLKESSWVKLDSVSKWEVLYVRNIVLDCINNRIGVIKRVKINTGTLDTAWCFPNNHVGVRVCLLILTKESKSQIRSVGQSNAKSHWSLRIFDGDEGIGVEV
jgi:hypothetical protein